MSFAQERSRRANAGNRMRALLDQEAEIEELFEKESLSDDEEFVTKPDDEVPDTFDSDFDTESSDEEREQELQAEQEDKAIEKEERQARRPKPPPAISTRRPLPTARQNAPSTPRRPREQKVRRAVDMPRQSSRSTTVKSRLHVEEQLRQYQSRKASIVKRDRPVTKRLTQEELLAEAAVTERENKASLEQWLEKEAEKKDKAKKKDKKGIVGPFVRYRSFTDGSERPKRRKLILIETATGNREQNVQTEITDPQVLAWHEQRDLQASEMEGRNLITFVHHPQQQQQQSIQGLTDRELDRVDLIPELASWTERHSRPVKPMLCPITGLQAQYKDPKTNVPYANLDAYKKIQACLNHKMVWSPGMKVYVGEPAGAANVPEEWELFLTGKGPSVSSSTKRHRS